MTYTSNTPRERCGFKWAAPYLEPPPSKRVRRVSQECVLFEGHEGPHRSMSNVIAPNEPDYVWMPGAGAFEDRP